MISRRFSCLMLFKNDWFAISFRLLDQRLVCDYFDTGGSFYQQLAAPGQSSHTAEGGDIVRLCKSWWVVCGGEWCTSLSLCSLLGSSWYVCYWRGSQTWACWLIPPVIGVVFFFCTFTLWWSSFWDLLVEKKFLSLNSLEKNGAKMFSQKATDMLSYSFGGRRGEITDEIRPFVVSWAINSMKRKRKIKKKKSPYRPRGFVFWVFFLCRSLYISPVLD